MILRQIYYYDMIKTDGGNHWQLYIKDNRELKEGNRDIDYHKTYIVRGHFPYYRYHFLKKEHGWNLITWLRDPVDRVISNYNHLVHRPKVTKKFLAHKATKMARKMSLTEFSKWQSDFQSRFTHEDPSVFDFIGIVEHFNKSMARFRKQFNMPSHMSLQEWHNVHGWPEKEEVHKNVLKELKIHHKKDYEFYNKVMERYK
jgi:hypothetical protein